jgi:hypothetical protein
MDAHVDDYYRTNLYTMHEGLEILKMT